MKIHFIAGLIVLASTCLQAYDGEPVVSQREAALLADAARMARVDPVMAADFLAGKMTSGTSAALDFTMGVYLARAGKQARAEDAYDNATKRAPGFQRAWMNLGRIRLSLGKPAKAAEAFGRMIESGNRAAETWRLLGYSHLLSGHAIASESAYRQALVLDPDNRQCMSGLIRALAMQSRNAEVISLAQRAIAADWMNADLWIALASSRLDSGQELKACADLETAMRLGKADAGLRLTLADLYFNMGLYDRAIDLYGSVAVHKIDPGRLLRFASALYYAKRVDAADSFLEKARKAGLKHEDRVKAYWLSGNMALSRKDNAAAHDAWEKGLELDPLNGRILLSSGRLYWQEGRLDQASMILERVPGNDPVKYDALVLDAGLKVDARDFSAAVGLLKKALAIDDRRQLRDYLAQVQKLARSNAVRRINP